MKEVKKARIRLSGYKVNIEEVKSVSVSRDGRAVSIVDFCGKKYETAIQNVVIITEEIEDERS